MMMILMMMKSKRRKGRGRTIASIEFNDTTTHFVQNDVFGFPKI